MPAYGAEDVRLGNNPLVMAVPFGDEAIVLDTAMSQFSYGAMQLAAMQGKSLPVHGGYDKEGLLTNDPSAVLASGRTLSIGYWKGAGLSLLLDILSAVLSGGLAIHQVSQQKVEKGLSQVFIAIDLQHLHHYSGIQACIQNIISDYKQSVSKEEVLYPGERVLKNRQLNTEKGIPVVTKVWNEVLSLQETKG